MPLSSDLGEALHGLQNTCTGDISQNGDNVSIPTAVW